MVDFGPAPNFDTRPSWYQLYISMCYMVAMRSPDQRTRLGAVITTKDHVVLGTGYNGIPRGVFHDPKHHVKPGKLMWFEHAERNAIFNAARIGARMDQAHTLYCPWLPCCDCARAIIQTGIQEVVYHAQGQLIYELLHQDGTVSTWNEQQLVAKEMFLKAGEDGVKLRSYNGPLLGDLTAHFSGKIFKIRLDGEPMQIGDKS